MNYVKSFVSLFCCRLSRGDSFCLGAGGLQGMWCGHHPTWYPGWSFWENWEGSWGFGVTHFELVGSSSGEHLASERTMEFKVLYSKRSAWLRGCVYKMDFAWGSGLALPCRHVCTWAEHTWHHPKEWKHFLCLSLCETPVGSVKIKHKSCVTWSDESQPESSLSQTWAIPVNGVSAIYCSAQSSVHALGSVRSTVILWALQ